LDEEDLDLLEENTGIKLSRSTGVSNFNISTLDTLHYLKIA
jgi:diketogulonate reductase-like aldo/keto reductase